MSEYRPPLEDIRFVLDHISHIDDIAQYPAFSHVDADLVGGILDEAGRFMAEVVAPLNRIGDTEGATLHPDGSVTLPAGFKEAYARYVAAGWNGVKSSPAYGGHGFPIVVGTAVQEMLTTASMAFSLCPMLTQSAVLALERHASDEQKALYLEKLISGEWTGTMVLTEPEAGSDLGALRARAVPQDDGSWRISGTKIYITWGEHDLADNIIHLVLARAPGAPAGTKGISLFIVPKYLPGADGEPGERNDIRCVSLEHKIGIHASPTCVLSFGDEGGAVGYLVGEVHQGMRAMFSMMNDARLHVGVEGLGIAERAYQLALGHARERRQGRAPGAPAGTASPIAEHPDVKRMLATMKASIAAMRGLLYDNAARLDAGEHHPDASRRERAAALGRLLTPVSKAWCTDVGVEVTSLGIQVHGGMGYVEETGAGQLWRDARIAPIYEGTNGIQAIDLVLRKLPQEGGAVVRAYLDEIEAVALEATAAGGDVGAVGESLTAAHSALAAATEWLLAATDVEDRLAGATPYLEMFGVVSGGRYLAQEAIAATRHAAGATTGSFEADRVATALFYARRLLPRAAGLLPSVTAGKGDLDVIGREEVGVS
jgi:alkylation response protein AidB-like acyl-CoA dehydrogenase